MNGNYIDVFGVTGVLALGAKSNGVDYYLYDQFCMNPVILHYIGNDEEKMIREQSLVFNSH